MPRGHTRAKANHASRADAGTAGYSRNGGPSCSQAYCKRPKKICPGADAVFQFQGRSERNKEASAHQRMRPKEAGVSQREAQVIAMAANAAAFGSHPESQREQKEAHRGERCGQPHCGSSYDIRERIFASSGVHIDARNSHHR